MISLLPKPYSTFVCPCCASNSVSVQGNLFQGIHWLAEVVCQDCSTFFLADFPIGHALFFSGRWIPQKNWTLKTDFEASWFQKPVSVSLNMPNTKTIPINRIIKHPKSRVIILNCLDYLYGHVLLKLWNAHYHLEQSPEFGLIVIIPESFEWLVPDNVAEIWSIPLKLKECLNYYPSLNNQIQEWLCEYQSVQLSLAHSHPEPSHIPIQSYTKVNPFPIQDFCFRKPVVTFIYREDRLWLKNRLQDRAWLFAQKYSFQSVKRYLLSVQAAQIVEYLETVHRLNPEIELRIVGIGKAEGMPSYVKDHRQSQLSSEDERNWCRCYAESHLVIGIHGSNMLLPTAHAAGFIEILPKARWGNLMQDIASPRQGRFLHFLGRFVDEFVSPKELAHLTAEIILRYPFFELSMSEKFLGHQPVTEVSFWTNFLQQTISTRKN